MILQFYILNEIWTYHVSTNTFSVCLLKNIQYAYFVTVRIRPICLPANEPLRSKNFNTEYMPFAAGWGRFQEDGRPSNLLYEQQIPILENEQCKKRYYEIGRLVSSDQFGGTVVCAGNLEGTQDNCAVDSGGFDY